MSEAHRLYVKHAVGSRMLLDTKEVGGFLHLSEVPGGWRFEISGVDLDAAREIADFKDELNLFYLEEGEEEEPQKWWYYGHKTPEIDYEANGRVLHITVDTRKAYSNRHV
ncbi:MULTISPECIES: hypothetical protein [Paenibacillus]|uniref:hypothetical protein n=1 Tax=Paenibacillus TaxID=44249 RepID=UPI00020D6F21|nr:MULTISPECIES: hypothetical protein [Paenibacillus]EGL16983.1 hypothetical protein HMPREF9413_3708 [Paenibacillus sp. HGF7]EPD82107.1 hypothetical protein HMPREF1207_03933 [Paenibacillus sp. HGH0039]MBV6714040.1 hypothetical protein [Paenibacillus chitinolyticus]